MALSYKLTMPKLGNISASSLVKSASTLTNEVNSYNDYIQKLNFTQDPTDQNFNAYVNYLQGRISTLSATGSITNIHKAAELQNEITSAYKTTTTFNIDTITTQMMESGNTSDQQKLDYLTQNVLTNPIVQSDAALYQKYMNQAYSFQQSIALEAQTQQTAAETQYTANETAMKQGYTNAVDSLKNSWQTVVDTFKNGGANEVNKAMADFTKQQAPLFKALGVNLPQGAQLTMASLAQAVLGGMHAYYENGAVALGSLSNPYGTGSPDAQAFQLAADKIANGITTISTPGGTMNIYDVNRWAQAPTNMYTPVTNENGITTMKENAVSGYRVVKGQVIPTTTGTPLSTFDALPKNTQTGLKTKLQNLGFNYIGTSSGNLKVQLTNKTAKWMGGKNSDLVPGDTVTLVSTMGGKGFQFLSDSGKVYGVSLDNRGLAALYGADSNGSWHMVQGQYGFNSNTTVTAQQHQNAAQVTAINNHIGVPNFNPTANPTQLQGGIGPSAYATNNNGYQMTQRAGGGFNFTHNGKAISAATYAMGTNTQFRTLLQTMANKGDTGAKSALNFVGNDYGYNPNAIGNNGNLYNALTWGTGRSFHGATPPNISGGGLTLPSGLKL